MTQFQESVILSSLISSQTVASLLVQSNIQNLIYCLNYHLYIFILHNTIFDDEQSGVEISEVIRGYIISVYQCYSNSL
ncbi:hypothetical protein EB796_010531 [Bugula neritina]|uniref:Uncharacterized protein n=1 Tax=Bugula neritina TaxID=10212 RepID=A0A7J7JZ19_BUGNE|nr:hypothetical protein EB796_010531 [Bugula neritina]